MATSFTLDDVLNRSRSLRKAEHTLSLFLSGDWRFPAKRARVRARLPERVFMSHSETNRRIVLASRPRGTPVPEDFRLEKTQAPVLAQDDVLLRTLYLSLDPYMRGMMNERAPAYTRSIAIGEVMPGGTVNRVVVNNVSNETFYAKVIMSTESRQVEVDSRPSDAIALALRARVPIFAESSVLDKAGVSGS